MKKILLILLLLNISVYAEKMSAESCFGLTYEIIESHTVNKKIDTINNLTVLCDSGCGKACVESSMIKAGTTNITDLKDKDLIKGCDANFSYGRACYLRRWTDPKNDDLHKIIGCENGYAPACDTIAFDYYYTDKDYKNAFKYYNKGCNLNDGGACYSVGRMFQNGEGMKKNYTKALEFYTKAEGLGNPAYLNTGLIYFFGDHSVAKNKIKAYEYWIKATKQGREGTIEAQKYLNSLCKESPWACK